jgi:aspartate oxidase
MRKLLLVAIAISAGACSLAPASDREVRLARLAAEHRQLMTQLDDLQVRLIVDRERVRFWTQMRDRHESISAVACTSQEAHAVAMLEAHEALERAESRGTHVRARLAALHSGPLDSPLATR